VNDRLLRAARRQPVDVTPVWVMRQAGRYLPEYRTIRGKVEFLELCKTPDLAAEVTVQPVTRLGVDAAIIFSDILIPVEAMGMELELGDKGPHFPHPLRTAADVARLGVPDPEEATGFVAEAIRRTRGALSDAVPVIGFAGAPFTLAAYMVEGGGSKSFILIKRLLFEQPKLAHALFEKLTETLIPYLKMQVEAGARIVQVFDSWGGELGPEDYETFALPYVQRIVHALKATGVPVIVFGTSMSMLLPQLVRWRSFSPRPSSRHVCKTSSDARAPSDTSSTLATASFRRRRPRRPRPWWTPCIASGGTRCLRRVDVRGKSPSPRGAGTSALKGTCPCVASRAPRVDSRVNVW